MKNLTKEEKQTLFELCMKLVQLWEMGEDDESEIELEDIIDLGQEMIKTLKSLGIKTEGDLEEIAWELRDTF